MCKVIFYILYIFIYFTILIFFLNYLHLHKVIFLFYILYLLLYFVLIYICYYDSQYIIDKYRYILHSLQTFISYHDILLNFKNKVFS